MAKVVDALPGKALGPNRKYPWGEWLDGQVWLLTPGEDFSLPPKNFQGLVTNQGRRYGVRVTTRRRPEGLYIQAFPKDQPDA